MFGNGNYFTAESSFEESQRNISVYWNIFELKVEPHDCTHARRCQTQLKFLGHMVDEHGASPDPDKTAAVREMKPPRNITEVRRLLGLANQLGKFSPNLAEISQPLRELLKKNREWLWVERKDDTHIQYVL